MVESIDSERVGDDELILRRIPVSKHWWNPVEQKLESEAFSPIQSDRNGLSVTRLRTDRNRSFPSEEDVGLSGKSKHGYYVAVLRVRDVRRLGLNVISDPIPANNSDGFPENSGHALIPELNYSDKETDAVAQWMAQLSDGHCIERVSGPFILSSD